jgi:hypothetical protein
MALTSALSFEHVIKGSGYGYDYVGYGLSVSEYAAPAFSLDSTFRPTTGVSANTFYFLGNTATVLNWGEWVGASLLINHSANSDYTKKRGWFSVKFSLERPPPECVILYYQDVPILTVKNFMTGAINRLCQADVCVDRERDEIRVYVDGVLVQTTPFWRGLSRQATSMIRFGSTGRYRLSVTGTTQYQYFAVHFKDIIFYDDTEDDTLCGPPGDYRIQRLPVVNAAGTGWSVAGSTSSLTVVLNFMPLNSNDAPNAFRAASPNNAAPLAYTLDTSSIGEKETVEGLFTLHSGYRSSSSATLQMKYTQPAATPVTQSVAFKTTNVMEYGVKVPIMNKSPAGAKWTKQALSQLSVETAIV